MSSRKDRNRSAANSSKKDTNIFTAIFPFYALLKVFGMFPASFEGEPSLGVFKVKRFDKIYPALTFGVMTIFTAAQIVQPIKDFNSATLAVNGWQAGYVLIRTNALKQSDVSSMRLLNCLDFSLSITMVLVMIAFVYQYFQTDEAITLLHILNDFDTKAKSLEVRVNMQATRTSVVKIISVIAVVIFIVTVGSALMFEFEMRFAGGYAMPLSYGYALIYLSLLILQFSLATVAIKRRFCLLNDNLRFTFQNTSIKCNSSINIQAIGYTEYLPNQITKLYSNLCDAIDLVNSSFTLQLIPFMVYYLMADLFSVFSIVHEIFYPTQLTLFLLTINVWWVILHTGLLSITLYAGYTTTRCAASAPTIISSIVRNYHWSKEKCVQKVFKTFLLELQYRNLVLENEFFAIDWKLLLSVS